MGKNVIVFGADISLSMRIDNKEKDILIIGKGPTQGLDDTTLTTEAKCHFNFTQLQKRFLLSLHYNRNNSFLFVNTKEMYKFKATQTKINDYSLCLGNISKDFTTNIMKKAGLKGNVKFYLLILILLILTIF